MASITHKAYTQSVASALTTELNSLANTTMSSASAAIDNSSNLDVFMDLELYIAAQGGSRSTGATVEVYLSIALDGSNYSDLLTSTGDLIAIFPLDAATTARYVTRRDIPIPPSATFKLGVYNRTGQSFASSGSTLKYRTHSIQSA